MSAAATVAKVLGGHRSADGWLCRCPVPSHGRGKGDRSPSLLIKDGERALLVKCFAGCESYAVIDELRRRGLLGGQMLPRISTAAPIAAPRKLSPHLPDEEALALWRAGVPIEGTLAERYLVEHRGCGVDPFPQALRFTESLVHPRYRGLYFPALLAAVETQAGEVVALQATYLQSGDGRKARVSHPRWTFGQLGEGAVRLGLPQDGALGLAEGLEDALAATKLTGIPTWAVLGCNRVTLVAIPSGISEVHIFADDDPSGREAAERAVKHFCANGHRVLVRLPPEGFEDWGEVAAERCAA